MPPVPKIPCRACGAVPVAWYSKSRMCKMCRQAVERRKNNKQTRYNIQSPRPRGQTVDAICWKCKGEWQCPPDRHPKYSICKDCRAVNAEMSGESWISGRVYLPNMGR